MGLPPSSVPADRSFQFTSVKVVEVSEAVGVPSIVTARGGPIGVPSLPTAKLETGVMAAKVRTITSKATNFFCTTQSPFHPQH